MTVHLLNAWLPSVMKDHGFDRVTANWVATGYQLGTLLGCVVTALLIGRSGWRQVGLFAALAAAALAATAALALGSGNVVLLVAGLIATGFFVVGAQNGINAATSATYPTDLRATGLGWGLGIGRLGSILGPYVGSFAASLGPNSARALLSLQIGPLLVAAVLAVWIAGRAEAQE
jgi:AAHS family 4-hydroxybenzoate transporter-like MFS transporter